MHGAVVSWELKGYKNKKSNPWSSSEVGGSQLDRPTTVKQFLEFLHAHVQHELFCYFMNKITHHLGQSGVHLNLLRK